MVDMKDVETIRAYQAHTLAKIIIKKREHSALSQIDMLSGEGSKLREQINKLKGIANALEWVVENRPTEDLYDDME